MIESRLVQAASPVPLRHARTMETVVVRRLDGGPRLVIEDPYEIALDFFSKDASSVGSDAFDAWVGRTDAVRIVTDDIYAINRTMRARSPHTAWAAFVGTPEPLSWLAALDPTWDLFELTPDEWEGSGAGAKVAAALAALTGPYRNLSVVTKVLHAKRPRLFPVLDSLVAEQVGWRAGAGPMTLLEHLRAEGQANLEVLQTTMERLATAGYRRTLVRVLDALLWTSHPAAGLGQELGRWERRFQLREGSSGTSASAGTTSGGRALEEGPGTRVDQQPDGLERDQVGDPALAPNPFEEAEPGGVSGVTRPPARGAGRRRAAPCHAVSERHDRALSVAPARRLLDRDGVRRQRGRGDRRAPP